MKRKIIIVDDSSFIRKIYEKSLTSDDVKVVGFDNPIEALEKINEIRPVCVISDFEMPEINGDEFCKRFRANQDFNDIPLIVFSMHDSDKNIIKCLENGADDYIPKRTNPEVMHAKVKLIMEVFEARRNKAFMEKVDLFNATISTLSHEFKNIFGILHLYIENDDNLKKLEESGFKSKIFLKSSNRLLETINSFEKIKNPKIEKEGFREGFREGLLKIKD